MITQAQIDAESTTPALTVNQKLVLMMLVRRYLVRHNSVWRFADLGTVIDAEITAPTEKTSALKAILTQLGKIPSFVVESQGSAEAQSFFSTTLNWQELAQDVLDILYEAPTVIGNTQSYAIAQRQTEKIVLKDRVIFTRDETGKRY